MKRSNKTSTTLHYYTYLLQKLDTQYKILLQSKMFVNSFVVVSHLSHTYTRGPSSSKFKMDDDTIHVLNTVTLSLLCPLKKPHCVLGVKGVDMLPLFIHETPKILNVLFYINFMEYRGPCII